MTSQSLPRTRLFRGLGLVCLLCLFSPDPSRSCLPPLPAGQEAGSFRVQTSQGYLDPEPSVVMNRGFAAVPVQELERLGWRLSQPDRGGVALWRSGFPSVEIQVGSPFLSWGGDGVQLAEAPYEDGGEIYLPIQFFIDILPWKVPELFQFDVEKRTLIVQDPDVPISFFTDPTRVVVIDPGHGGRDPGSKGGGGTQEKDVALAIGRLLARELEGDADLEVYLTRDADTLIPIWKRGELATRWRGEYPGVFISIHTNAVPNAVPNAETVRGFETYFLSEARTEHERRVAALENAAQEFEALDEGMSADPDLSFILTELRSLDHQHWSALLAGLVQDEIGRIHPGPNRGVKQGPLAVITNALMPAVLVEVGFVTNPDEERLLTQGSFQETTAAALAAAVREFFLRYPTGSSQ